jgi:hypothetical protein
MCLQSTAFLCSLFSLFFFFFLQSHACINHRVPHYSNWQQCCLSSQNSIIIRVWLAQVKKSLKIDGDCKTVGELQLLFLKTISIVYFCTRKSPVIFSPEKTQTLIIVTLTFAIITVQRTENLNICNLKKMIVFISRFTLNFAAFNGVYVTYAVAPFKIFKWCDTIYTARCCKIRYRTYNNFHLRWSKHKYLRSIIAHLSNKSNVPR